MGRSSLAIIIPAKNEVKTIGRVIQNARKFGTVVVVDDGSTDGTDKVSIVKGAKLIKNKKNLFYDKSLNKGFEYVKKKKFKFIITIDGDGEHDLNMIPIFVKKLNRGYDLVIGRRKNLPRFSEKVISFIYQKKYNVSDMYCGMKGYNSKWVKCFKKFDRFGSIGTDLASRIINQKNTKFIEVFIKINKRKDKPTIGNNFFANLRIFKSFFLNLANN